MRRIQGGLATVAALLAFVPAASACDEPSKSGERERLAVEAGDKVAIDVPNTLEGARWELRIDDADTDGDPLADGIDEDSEEGVTVRFAVPDFGDEPRDVDLVIGVTHEADDADWSREVGLEYRGRPAPEPAEEPAPQPQAQEPAPPAEPPRQEPPAPEPSRQADSQAAPAAVAAPPPPAPPASAPAEPVRAAPAPDRIGMVPAAGASAPPPAAAPGPAGIGLDNPPVAVPAPAERASRSARRRHVVPRPSEPAPAEPRQPPPADAPEGGVRLPDVDLPGFGAGLAWTLIAGGALSFAVAGLALGGIARHRRRRRLVLR